MSRVQGSDNILTSEQLFPLSQHSGANFPLAIIAPSQHDESEDLQTMRRLMMWMKHVAYMSTFFFSIDRAKIYSPLLMNVGGQHFFSPPNFYQINLCLPIGTNNFKLSFFSDIRWFLWKWLIVTKQTNSPPERIRSYWYKFGSAWHNFATNRTGSPGILTSQPSPNRFSGGKRMTPLKWLKH